MNTALFLILATLTGCQSIAQALPTVSHCEHVTYTRTGPTIHIEADCLAY